MWTQHLLHKHENWFAGAVLAGGYPLWCGEAEQLKAASQLIQTGVRTAIIHASNDEHSNMTLHRPFWGTILWAPLLGPPGAGQTLGSMAGTGGQELRHRSPTVHLIVRESGHAGCEVAVFGIRAEEFEEAWNFVLPC